MSDGNRTMRQRSTSPLLFHYLSVHQANWYVIMKRLSDAPEEAAVRTQEGATALYKALYRRVEDYPYSSIVDSLLDAYPPAMWHSDHNYCPLRAACWRRASLAILVRLLHSRPSRPYDVAALHALWNSYENLFGDELLPTIIYGGREGAEIWMKVHILLEYCTRNSMGNHQNLHAAAATPSCTLELLRLSYSFFPEQCRQRDRWGKLPLHYLLSGQGYLISLDIKPKEASITPLTETTRIAKHDPKPVDELEKLKQLLQWFPSAVTVRDTSSHQLPLHTAILYGRPWSWIELLLQVSYDTLSQVDHATGLYPFQLAASSEACSLTVTFELIRAAPYLVQDGRIRSSQSDARWNPVPEDEDELAEYQTVEEMMDIACRRDDPEIWKDVYTLLSYRVSSGPWYVVHAAASLPSCPIGLLELAIFMQRHELSQHNPDGNLPLHLSVQHQRPFAIEPHHGNDTDDDDAIITQIQILLHYYPTAASLKDSQGRLPLHVAVCTAQPWVALKSLIHAYPPALVESDARGCYPFQIAAVEDPACLSHVYELLHAAPHLLGSTVEY